MNPSAPARIGAAIYRRYGEPVEVPSDLSGADALALMNERSVCRRSRAEPVPERLLRRVFATALASPSKSDLQQASLVRVLLPAGGGMYPEVSAGQHRFTVRFVRWRGVGARPAQVNQDVRFELAIC